jgi:hypothetical protein
MLSEEAELPPAERPRNQSAAVAAWLVDENPRKVTGSSQRSPLHAAGCLHFRKCALQAGTRTLTGMECSRAHPRRRETDHQLLSGCREDVLRKERRMEGEEIDQAAAQARRVQGHRDLQTAINRYLAETNDNPKPFIWTADSNAIIEKVRRGKKVLASIG